MKITFSKIEPATAKPLEKLQQHYSRWNVKCLAKDVYVPRIEEQLEGKIVKRELKNEHLIKENLKKHYEALDTPFLMPDEVWSNKKIQSTVDKLHEEIKIMKKNGVELNKESFQAKVDELVPNSNIKIKDFNDLRKNLEDEGRSPQEIEHHMRASALHGSDSYSSTLYLKFENSNSKSSFDKIAFLDCTLHEFKHSLTARKTNHDIAVSKPQNRALNFIFNKFEAQKPKKYLQQLEINQKTFLEYLNLSSMKEVYSKFKTDFKEACKVGREVLGFKMPKSVKQKKDVFKYMKLSAQDEKEACSSLKLLRELYNGKSTNAELKQKYYEEAEKFFHNEMVDTLHAEWLANTKARKAQRM